MPQRQGKKTERQLGAKILSCISRVLRRCEEVGERIGYPGEGGERRFRAWLNSDLLQSALGWPSGNVAVGEIFDLLLLDDDQHPLATIETKTPYHTASAKERRDFEARLSGFPTLKTAYFTNGLEWDRLDILVSNGQLSTLDRSRLDIRKDAPAVAELFFAPLLYESENRIAIGQVYRVNRDNAFIKTTLTRLAADIDQAVGDFKEFYRRLFYGLREGNAGVAAQQVTLAVYEQWCGKSLRVTPRLAAQNLISLFKHEGANPLNITRALSALGLGDDGQTTPQKQPPARQATVPVAPPEALPLLPRKERILPRSCRWLAPESIVQLQFPA